MPLVGDVEQELAWPKDRTWLWDSRFNCLFSVVDKVLNPSVDPSRNVVLPEFMNKEAVVHFVKSFGEIQD